MTLGAISVTSTSSSVGIHTQVMEHSTLYVLYQRRPKEIKSGEGGGGVQREAGQQPIVISCVLKKKKLLLVRKRSRSVSCMVYRLLLYKREPWKLKGHWLVRLARMP